MDLLSSRRLFVAVPLPGDLKSSLGARCRELAEKLPFQKWVHPQDLHITLQFLGDTPSAKLAEIEERLQEAASPFAELSLYLAGLGVFGPPAAPSILWAGLQGDVQQLQKLQLSVAAGMEAAGFEPERRPFSPHLTLARKYNGTGRFDRAWLQSYAIGESETAWKADRIVLYESHLKRRPMYEAFKAYPLK